MSIICENTKNYRGPRTYHIDCTSNGVLKNKIPFYKKMFIDSIGTALFMGILFPIGWYLGKGATEARSLEQKMGQILTVVIMLFIVTHLTFRVTMVIVDKREQRRLAKV